MKRITSPLTTPIAALLAMMIIMQPAKAWLVGPGACKSHHPGVSTHDTQWKGKRCYPDCGTVIGPKHNFAKVAVLYFHWPEVPAVPTTSTTPGKPGKPAYFGPVRVGVMSNDSRLGTGLVSSIELGTLVDEDSRLTKWYIPFTGLKPSHYYTLVIYDPSVGPSQPFSRKCFLTSRSPGS